MDDLLKTIQHQVSERVVAIDGVLYDDTSPSVTVTVKLDDGSTRNLQASLELAYAEGPRLGDTWDPEREWPTKRIQLKGEVEIVVDVLTNIGDAGTLESVLGYAVSEAIDKAILRVEAGDAGNNHAIIKGYAKVSEDEPFPMGIEVGVKEVKP